MVKHKKHIMSFISIYGAFLLMYSLLLPVLGFVINTSSKSLPPYLRLAVKTPKSSRFLFKTFRLIVGTSWEPQGSSRWAPQLTCIYLKFLSREFMLTPQ